MNNNNSTDNDSKLLEHNLGGADYRNARFRMTVSIDMIGEDVRTPLHRLGTVVMNDEALELTGLYLLMDELVYGIAGRYNALQKDEYADDDDVDIIDDAYDALDELHTQLVCGLALDVYADNTIANRSEDVLGNKNYEDPHIE